MSYLSIAETTASLGIARSVNSSLNFEAESDMNYAKRMQDDRSIFNKDLRNIFDKKNLAPKLKQKQNTDRGNSLSLSFHI